MSAAFICENIRTPIGRYGGRLAMIRPDDLAATAIRAVLTQTASLPPEAIDDVILGCANQAGEDNRNIARMSALLAGLPTSVGGVTVNRLCASGLDAVGTAARAIIAGEADVIVAGGVESMSRAPYVLGKADRQFTRDQQLFDTTIGWRFINKAMQAAYGTDSMPETAQNLADELSISRDDQDLFALRSHQRALSALAFHSGQTVAVETGQDADQIFDRDEHPRQTSLEALGRLRPIARTGGSVTAGNSSGVNDGAAALVIASEAAITRYGLVPCARIVGMASAGVPPRTMGIGPVPATRKLLDRIGWTIGSIDHIELNEAFAAQAIAVIRELGLPDDAESINPYGGAIALGHPLGMSGARLAMTAARCLTGPGKRRAVVTLCVGVGQGLSLALERV